MDLGGKRITKSDKTAAKIGNSSFISVKQPVYQKTITMQD